jgi:hypothetical protein
VLRRQDEVSVIGEAIEAKVAGEGIGGSRHGWGCTRTWSDRWLRRFAERAGLVGAHFTRYAVGLDPELGLVL